MTRGMMMVDLLMLLYVFASIFWGIIAMYMNDRLYKRNLGITFILNALFMPFAMIFAITYMPQWIRELQNLKCEKCNASGYKNLPFDKLHHACLKTRADFPSLPYDEQNRLREIVYRQLEATEEKGRGEDNKQEDK